MRKGHRGGERGNQILELSDAMMEWAIARTHAGERVEVRELPAPAERRLRAGGRGPR